MALNLICEKFAYRIHAYILKDNSPFQAEHEFEKAIEINPKSSLTRYAYTQFLIKEQDFDRAEEQINQALKLDDDIALITCQAWILTLKGDYLRASELYAQLIPKQKSRQRKFRISTREMNIQEKLMRYSQKSPHQNI